MQRPDREQPQAVGGDAVQVVDDDENQADEAFGVYEQPASHLNNCIKEKQVSELVITLQCPPFPL